MSNNPQAKKPDPRMVYADIINLPHWQSPTRPHMSLYDRSAQFAAYKALSGYEDMVNEEARLTEDELSLGDEDLQILNNKINLIQHMTRMGEHPTLAFTVFVPDEYKQGGEYIIITAAVKRIDTALEQVILMETKDRTHEYEKIDFSRIVDIQGKCFEEEQIQVYS